MTTSVNGGSALRHEVALITGASRGIGAAIARRFAAEGAAVALLGRDEAALSSVSGTIQAAGGKAMLVLADVTRFEELEGARRSIESSLGPIDVLVANAGGNPTPPNVDLDELSEEGFRAAVDGNLIATFLSLKSVLPGMKERQRGSIITISSAAARRPTPASPLPYAAAKAGIELLTQHVAMRVGRFNIRANCIAPETILTEKNQSQMPLAVQERLAAEHPIRRLGTPEDVAEAALFLASEKSGWISGAVLDVAGGAVLVR